MFEEIHRIDTLERDVKELERINNDKSTLQAILTESLYDDDEEATGYKLLLDQPLQSKQLEFKVLGVEAKEERTTPPPKVELKPLPSLL